MGTYNFKNVYTSHSNTDHPLCTFELPGSTGPVFDKDGILILNYSFTDSNPKIPVNLKGQYFVECLMIWESFDNTWMHEKPLVLRFEDFDLVVSGQGKNTGLNLWQGSLDTQAQLNLVPNNSLANKLLNKGYCTQWLRYTSLECFAGNHVVRTNLETVSADGDIKIIFDNDSMIQIKNDRGLLTISTRP